VFGELLSHPGVVEAVELRSTFGFMAFHGGLEGGTETVAARAAAASGASLYTVVQPPDLVWHVPSSRIDPAQSEHLARFLAHVEVVVAIHGYGRAGRPHDVLLGGTNRSLAAELAASLRSSSPRFAMIDDLDAIPPELRGLHPSNPVNRPAAGGVQVELPPRARGSSPDPRHRGQPCTPAVGVVAGLARVASCWAPERHARRGQSSSKVPPARQ